jgi:hypothetical protein
MFPRAPACVDGKRGVGVTSLAAGAASGPVGGRLDTNETLLRRAEFYQYSCDRYNDQAGCLAAERLRRFEKSVIMH